MSDDKVPTKLVAISWGAGALVALFLNAMLPGYPILILAAMVGIPFALIWIEDIRARH
jgi:hypothetical protein